MLNIHEVNNYMNSEYCFRMQNEIAKKHVSFMQL